MVFIVTSSTCKVKIARFYELLFTLGWRLTKSKSLYKFPLSVACFISKIKQFELPSFHSAWHQIGMLSRWKKVFPLDFQQYNHFKYQKICLCASMLVFEWKERAFIEKVNSRCFVDFRRPYHWYTKTVQSFQYFKGAMSPHTHARANENKLEKVGPTFSSSVGDFGRLFLSV